MPKNGVSVKKSANFDRNMNGKAMASQAEKNLYKITSVINTTAKQRFIPIATRATLNSAKLQRVGKKIILSSINYMGNNYSSGGRYDYKKANKQYKTGRGTVPAGKNAGKFQWYDKAEKYNRGKIDKLKTKDVLK